MSEYDREIGAGPTATPPRDVGHSDPGDVYLYGPNFVSFVQQRFAKVEQLLAGALDVLRRTPLEGQRFLGTGNLDSSGNGKVEVFVAAPNQKFVVHRLYIHAQTYSWPAPFTDPAGEVLLLVNDKPWDGYSLVSGQGALPAVFTAGRLAGLEIQDGESLRVQFKSGPRSLPVECRVAGVLSNVGVITNSVEG